MARRMPRRFEVGDKVRLCQGSTPHGAERTGTVLNQVRATDSDPLYAVHWDQLGYSHIERARDLTRIRTEVWVEDWARADEVDAYAHQHGLSFADAMIELVNSGLSHYSGNMVERADNLAFERR